MTIAWNASGCQKDLPEVPIPGNGVRWLPQGLGRRGPADDDVDLVTECQRSNGRRYRAETKSCDCFITAAVSVDVETAPDPPGLDHSAS